MRTFLNGHHGWPFFMVLTVSAAVGGCAVAPVARAPADGLEALAVRQAQVTQSPPWQVEARIALTDGRESWQAALLWRQGGDRFELQMRGPFGQGGGVMKGDGRSVRLRLRDGRQAVGDDAGTLLARLLGWTIPVAELRYWIRGVPATTPYEQLRWNREGEIESFRQAGWSLHFSQYRLFENQRLPRKITAQGQRWRIKVVVDRWRWTAAGKTQQ